MIQKLQNDQIEVAKRIRTVFQESYAVEAKLLSVIDFPPLKRPLEAYIHCTTEFFGYWKENELAGVVEINHTDRFTHIQSLVVKPDFFRQGIAKELMIFVLNSYAASLFIVETGLLNKPAINLYEKFGFNIVSQYKTDHAIDKVKLELIANN